jgi:hypothetical protein
MIFFALPCLQNPPLRRYRPRYLYRSFTHRFPRKPGNLIDYLDHWPIDYLDRSHHGGAASTWLRLSETRNPVSERPGHVKRVDHFPSAGLSLGRQFGVHRKTRGRIPGREGSRGGTRCRRWPRSSPVRVLASRAPRPRPEADSWSSAYASSANTAPASARRTVRRRPALPKSLVPPCGQRSRPVSE